MTTWKEEVDEPSRDRFGIEISSTVASALGLEYFKMPSELHLFALIPAAQQ